MYKIYQRQVRRRVFRPIKSHLEKIVVKTAVKTVLAIIIILAVAFAVFNFAFPQQMATICENLGNYSLAVKYSSLRYSYTGSGLDLARCFENSLSLGDDDYIIEFGEELVGRSDFDDVCHSMETEFYELNDKYLEGERIEFDYEQRVKGKLAASYYCKGETTKAINYAFETNGTSSFASGNALILLYAEIKSAGDGDAAQIMLEKLALVTPADEDQRQMLVEVTQSLRAVVVADK